MKELRSQFAALKHRPEAGAVSVSRKAEGRDFLMQAIGHQEVVAERIAAGEKTAFSFWTMRQFISMPIASLASLCILVFGGWMTTVNAASSLPGDTLYNVKLITERARLRFVSLEHKAVLHTEFAERRLQEVVALSTDPNRQDDLEKAASAFQRELALAEGDLRRMQEEGSQDTLAVAGEVENKIDQLAAVISDSSENTAQVPQVTQAQEVAREASQSVVEVMVDTHEASEDQELSSREMLNLYKDTVSEIRDTEAFLLGRLAVVERIATEMDLDIEEIHALEYDIATTMERMGEADAFVAAGGYRAAFEVVNGIDATLREAERSVNAIEFSIVQERMMRDEQRQADEQENTEEPAVEDNQSLESTIDSTADQDS